MFSDKLTNYTINLLDKRGVTISELAHITYELQISKVPNITIDECIESVYGVLRKREVQNAVITGIELDTKAENGELSQPLLSIIQNDEGLYGIDENLANGICNLFGTIAFTNYGYVDRVKTGLIEQLDLDEDHVNTFIDDLVGAIAACAASRLAHSSGYSSYAQDGLDQVYTSVN